MKKTFTFILALALITLLAGCSSQTPADTPAETSPASTPKENNSDKPRVAMIFEMAMADGGWAAACYDAMAKAAEELGFETAYTENVALSDFVSAFRDYANMGYDLVIAPGNQYQDAVLEVAPDFPDVNFLIMDATVDTLYDNVASAVFDYKELGFLEGVIAAAQTKTGSIGLVNAVEGYSNLLVTEYAEIGAKYVNPDINFTVGYVGNFTDIAKGKEIASSMITTQNVDVIINYAGAPDVGAREACRELGAWAIPHPEDILDTDPDVIMTCVIDSTPYLIKSGMQEVLDGTFGGGKQVLGTIGNGAISIGRFGEMVDAETRDYITDVLEKIKSGEIVPSEM